MCLLRRLIVIIGVFTLFGGCKDEPESPVLTIAGNEVLISNEGNFGWGDGSLSLYSPTDKSVQNEVFKSKNGIGLGNVFQSISHHNNQYFFVLNNSNKVVVASDSLDQINEITGLTSPRYFYPVADNKAYVTDLYSNAISIVDLNTLAISSTIKLEGWTEKAVIVNGEFWVTNLDQEYVYIIDIGSDAITDSIRVGFAPESIVDDLQGTIWVLSKGDKATSKVPQLTAINASSKEVVKVISLAGLPANLVFNASLNQLYYLNNGIFKMAADTASTPELWKESNNNNFYGLGVDINSNDVYVSDIHDFVQKSTIYRFSEAGDLLDEFKTGIIAGNFFFP